MNSYDFSVIVLCYNPKLDSLIQTITSVIKQENVTFEIIICDDGSKIEYEDKIKDWISLNKINIPIKYIFKKNNQGTIINYLNGINVAKGKYIKPISPGDYLFNNNTLELYKKTFENTECEIVFSDAVYYFENKIIEKRQYPKSRQIFKSDKLLELYCIYGYFFLGATLCSKKIILMKYLNLVKEKIFFLEDYSMVVMALLDGVKIVGIEKPCIWYEYGNGISTNQNGNIRIVKDSNTMLQILKELYPNNSIVDKMILINNIRIKSSKKKYIEYLLYFPKLYLLKILSKTFYKQLTYKTNLNEMKKIINLEEKDENTIC